jgi:hypothetical protein
MVSILISHTKGVNLRNESDNTPLHVATTGQDYGSTVQFIQKRSQTGLFIEFDALDSTKGNSTISIMPYQPMRANMASSNMDIDPEIEGWHIRSLQGLVINYVGGVNCQGVHDIHSESNPPIRHLPSDGTTTTPQ